MQHDQQFSAQFQQSVSTPRLSGYALPEDENLTASICRYLWNNALCEALYPTLHGVEVSLRNIIDRRMRVLKGEFWFDDPANLLVPRQGDHVQTARDRLQRDHLPATHDRIVAELVFGFWTGMMARPYQEMVWIEHVATDFSGVPRERRSRANIATRLDGIRALRNRASHHESIWRREHLRREYECVVEALLWFSPALHASVRLIDRFPDLYAAGPMLYQTEIESLCLTWAG